MSKKIQAIGFNSSKGLPKPVEKLDKRENIIKWGEKNDYPFYLIEMFNGSAWHQGIIKTKTHYVAGGGVEIVNGQLDEFIENKNSDFTIEEISKKVAFDFELFEGFAIVGTWNREGSRVVRWEHVDIDKIRTNINQSEFYFSEDWNARKQSPETTGHRIFKPLDRTNPQGKFIIYYKSPAKQSRGEMGIYPKPSYVGGLTSINTDVLISQYHLYEIQNGFKGGTIVSLNTGQPGTQEEAEAYRDEIKGSTTDISDSNQLIITFADGQENAPTVLSLNGNDLADRYNLTEKSVQQNILVCHSATNPLMFGIKTEGQLGGSTELLESFEIFKNTYVTSRQKTIEYFLNMMVELSGFTGTVELAESAPIKIETDSTPEEMTQEFRSSDKDLKIFSQYGSKREDFKIVRSFSVKNDFGSAEVEQMETRNFSGFFDKIGDIRAALTDIDKNVLELLRRGEDGADIAGAIDAPLMEVAKSIQRLEKLNLLVDSGTSELGERVLEGLEIDVNQFEVRYSYEVKPGFGAEIISTSRDFCKELIRQDRMYLRTELDQISTAVDRDVWRYRGGFYNNSTTGRTTPWCRHEWVQHLVTK
tara:strand:+ start:3117 stop:4880 length:1764 start_codon:yes stop_codon:yes gene_type:complete